MSRGLQINKGYIFLAILVGTVFLFSGNTYAPPYSIYNTSELGVSKFYQGISDTEVFQTYRSTISPLGLSNFKNKANQTMIIIVGSERQYLDGELEVYSSFLKAGGTILLFEDFGPARAIAERFGVVFMNGVYKETNPDLYTNSPDKPLVFDSVLSEVVGFQLPPLQMNRAVPVVDVSGFVDGTAFPILMPSSSSSFVDINDNNIVENGDFSGNVPLGIFKTVNEIGKLVVFGDASLPINQNWNSKFTYQGVQYDTGNAFYSILILLFLSEQFGIHTIIFDESHQAIDLMSTNGILSFVIGAYLTFVSSSLVVPIVGLFVGLLLISSRRNINIMSKLKVRMSKDYTREDLKPLVISRPTKVERQISEQYILYQRMKRGTIHIAIHELLSKIESTGKGSDFLAEFRQKYPDLSDITDFNKLRQIYSELYTYLESNLTRWL